MNFTENFNSIISQPKFSKIFNEDITRLICSSSIETIINFIKYDNEKALYFLLKNALFLNIDDNAFNNYFCNNKLINIYGDMEIIINICKHENYNSIKINTNHKNMDELGINIYCIQNNESLYLSFSKISYCYILNTPCYLLRVFHNNGHNNHYSMMKSNISNDPFTLFDSNIVKKLLENSHICQELKNSIKMLLNIIENYDQ